MKLLQRYPWLIDPTDEREWVPVEATPIVESLVREVDNGRLASFALPCRAPWDNTWLEFTLPTGTRVRAGCAICDAGWVDEAERDAIAVAPKGRVVAAAGSNGDTPIHEAQAFLVARLWASAARGRPSELGFAKIYLGETGELLCMVITPSPEAGLSVASLGSVFMYVVGVFAFLNCKNVTTGDEPPPSPALAKKRRKRGVAEIIYKQLVVDGKPISRGPGKEDPEEADFRYHICRGHFADHREHGLFRKESLKGIYWVPMHARGSKGAGEIVKDYEVRP